MKERYKDINFLPMDARKLLFPDKSFDLVFDKGVYDALSCGDDSTDKIDEMISEVSRVIKDNGKYLIISFGFPSLRMQFFKQKHFDVRSFKIATTEATVKDEYGTVDDKTSFWVYYCIKQACSDNTDTKYLSRTVLDKNIDINNSEEVEAAVNNLQFTTNPLCKN